MYAIEVNLVCFRWQLQRLV